MSGNVVRLRGREAAPPIPQLSVTESVLVFWQALFAAALWPLVDSRTVPIRPGTASHLVAPERPAGCVLRFPARGGSDV